MLVLLLLCPLIIFLHGFIVVIVKVMILGKMNGFRSVVLAAAVKDMFIDAKSRIVHATLNASVFTMYWCPAT